jgi:hypothetical protein
MIQRVDARGRSRVTPFRRRIRGDRSDHERHVKFTARPSATLVTYRAKQPWPLTSRGSIRPPRRAAPVVWNALKAGAGGFTCADARSAGTSDVATIRQANMRRRTTTRRGIQLSRVLSRRKTGSTTFGRKCSSTVPCWLPRCHILFINPCQGRRVASRTTGSRGSTEHQPSASFEYIRELQHEPAPLFSCNKYATSYYYGVRRGGEAAWVHRPHLIGRWIVSDPKEAAIWEFKQDGRSTTAVIRGVGRNAKYRGRFTGTVVSGFEVSTLEGVLTETSAERTTRRRISIPVSNGFDRSSTMIRPAN